VECNTCGTEDAAAAVAPLFAALLDAPLLLAGDIGVEGTELPVEAPPPP
jgi:hypothetical protein